MPVFVFLGRLSWESICIYDQKASTYDFFNNFFYTPKKNSPTLANYIPLSGLQISKTFLLVFAVLAHQNAAETTSFYPHMCWRKLVIEMISQILLRVTHLVNVLLPSICQKGIATPSINITHPEALKARDLKALDRCLRGIWQIVQRVEELFRQVHPVFRHIGCCGISIMPCRLA